MNCPSCGADIDNGAISCPSCGVLLTLDEEHEITAKINTKEVIQQWEERAEKAKNVQIVTRLGARTDLGRVRENNEDKFDFFEPEDEDKLALKGCLYAVADGMGGHSAGQIASELALKTAIRSYFDDKSPMLEESLRAALQQANALIFESARAITERQGMGTTITALVLRGEEAFVAQVGDSRCYRVRGNRIEQITEDHSWVNEQVKRGGMTEEEANSSPFRNVITRSLGNAPTVEVDIYQLDLEAGDIFLLCSDGLSGDVKPDEMLKALTDNSPSEAAWKLVDIALERGGRDNTTCLVVSVKDILHEDKQTKAKGLARLFNRG